MSRDVVSRFRITVRPWPEQLFPVAAVDHPAHVSVDEEGRLHDSQPYGLKELPPEAVLRELFDADLDEPVGVVAFLSELGWTNRGNEDLRLAQLEYDHPRHPKEPSAQLVWSTRTTTAFEIVSDNPEIEVGIREHFPLMWWEVAARLRAIRAAARHWIAWRESDACRAVWTEEGFRPGKNMDESVYGGPDGVAWQWFSEIMRLGLETLTPRVVISQRDPGFAIYRHGLEAQKSDLVGALTTQLFNMIVENMPTRQCARCGRPFFRQTGRAARGQNRTKGVLYCSSSCARAHAQQEYRRRNKKGSGFDSKAKST